jgi:hypothetical protein
MNNMLFKQKYDYNNQRAVIAVPIAIIKKQTGSKWLVNAKV